MKIEDLPAGWNWKQARVSVPLPLAGASDPQTYADMSMEEFLFIVERGAELVMASKPS